MLVAMFLASRKAEAEHMWGLATQCVLVLTLHVTPLTAHTWKPSRAGQTPQTERNGGQCSALCLPCPDEGRFSAVE